MSHSKSVIIHLILLLGALLADGVSLAQDPPPGTILEPGPTFLRGYAGQAAPPRKVPNRAIPDQLSFSPDDAFLACGSSYALSILGWIDVFDIGTEELAWSWHNPEVLSTSAGDFLFAPCYWLRKAGMDFGFEAGWPGNIIVMFQPGSASRLAIAHSLHACETPMYLEEDESANVRILRGMWFLGAYVHFFDSTGFDYAGTFELQEPIHLERERGQFANPLADITAMDYSPSGTVLATGDSDGLLTLWSDKGDRRDVRVSKTSITAIDFSPRSDMIATIDHDGVVGLWDTKDLEQVADLHCHTAEGYWVAFSPDGSRLLSAARDNTVRVWDVAKRKAEKGILLPPELGEHALFSFAGAENWVYATGNTLADGGTLWQFEIDTGHFEPIAKFPGRSVLSQTVSPSGRFLAIGLDNGTVLTWHLQPPERQR